MSEPAEGRLAVRLPNWLGDALLALRAVDALAAAHGPTGLVLLGRPWAHTLLAPRYPGAHWLAAPEPGGRWLPAVSALAARRAGTIVVFPPSASARLHAYSARIPRRIGLAGEALDFLLTQRAPRGARGTRHLEDEYLDLARLAGAEPVPRAPLVPTPEAVQSTAALLERAGVPDTHALLVLAPGARYGPAKRWPPERFAAAGDGWARAGERRTVVLVGGAEDSAEARAVRAASAGDRDAPVDLVGKTTLPELVALLARAQAVVANDSGLAHLAAAAERPVVTVFGSTDPRWTSPRGDFATVLSRPPSCSPCFRRTCAVPDRYRCLRAIGVGDVMTALHQERGPA